MDSITAIFNICFCDYGTVLIDKHKTRWLLAKLVLGKIPGSLYDLYKCCLMKLLISRSLTWWIQGLSSTCPVFKYFQGLEFRRKNSSTFKVAWEPWF